MNSLDKIFKDGIESGAFPGAVLLVGDSHSITLQKTFGYRAIRPEKEENSIDTIYDIASMTKVVATTPAIMKLVENGLLRLYDPVSLFIEGYKVDPKNEIRIFHLLTHTSGLPPYSEAWRYSKGKELLESINSIQPINPAGKKFVYSCLNFITLMEIVERITSTPFNEFVKDEIFNPAGMKKTAFNPPVSWKKLIAPTSDRDGKILRGQVDDELAYYIGGVSGNAGLFSDVSDLYSYAKIFLNGGEIDGKKIFSKETIRAFTQERFNDGETRRAFGWDMKGLACSCGDLFSDKAFGHTGFTGTSIWIDPVIDLTVIILTNRVHLSRRENQDMIIRFRPLIHNYIVAHRDDLH